TNIIFYRDKTFISSIFIFKKIEIYELFSGKLKFRKS
ncbi:MAG: hypothetical protein ACI90C_000791, partial [Rhodoferax sp.]